MDIYQKGGALKIFQILYNYFYGRDPRALTRVMNILIIGKSKAALNFSRYLKILKIKSKIIPYRELKKYKDHLTSNKIEKYCAVFILTRDEDIIPTYKRYLKGLKNKRIFHFSGSVYHKCITSIHPIFSFPDKPIRNKDFKNIIFTSENPEKVKKTIPWFKNKIIKINKKDKIYYHSLLTIYFSFPLIIKRIIEKEMKKFNIPRNYLHNLLKKKIENKNSNITGVLARNDKKIISKHLKSLKKTKYYGIYKEILKIWSDYENN